MISWAGLLALLNFALLLSLFVAGSLLLRRAARRVHGRDGRERVWE